NTFFKGKKLLTDILMNKIILKKDYSIRFKDKNSLAHQINYFLLLNSFKGSEYFRKLISRIIIPASPKKTIICPTIYDFSLIAYLRNNNIIEHQVYRFGTYEAGVINVLKNFLVPGDIFIDIGSNIGMISLAASKYVGNKGLVYSFEPEPTIYNHFLRNIKLNSIRNIQTFNYALGSKRENLKIYYHRDFGNATFLKYDIYKSTEKETLIEPLDDVITTKNIKEIKMIKIDVEGWELEVLLGAKNLLKSKNAPILCLELSSTIILRDGKPSDIIDFILSSNNYKMYKLIKGKYFISDLIEINDCKDLPAENDNYFFFLPSHIRNFRRMLKNRKR
ncbi:MAG: FkbM family methyltransferase, partial [Promethearchaeota archaeon]